MRSIFVLLILVMIGLNGKGQSVTALPDSVLSQCCLEVTLLNGNVTTVDWVFVQYITRDGTGTKLFVEYAPNFGGIQWETQIRIQDDFDEVLERSKFIMLPFTVGSTDYAVNRNWIANIEENTTTGGTWVYGRFGTPTKRKFSAVEDYETLKNLLLACRPRAIVVAENGLYTDGDTVRMGGFLIEDTEIETNTHDFTILEDDTNLKFGLKYNYVLGDTVFYFDRIWQGDVFKRNQWYFGRNKVTNFIINDTSTVQVVVSNQTNPSFNVTTFVGSSTGASLIVSGTASSYSTSNYAQNVFTSAGTGLNSASFTLGSDSTISGLVMGLFRYPINGKVFAAIKTPNVDDTTAVVGQFLQLKDALSGEVEYATLDLSSYLEIGDTAAMLANYVTFGNLSGYPTGTGITDRSARWSGTNTLAAGNITDNGTKLEALKPWQFQSWTTAGRPTGVTGYTGYNTTGNGIEWYDGTRWNYVPKSDRSAFTSTYVPFSNSSGQFTESANFLFNSSTVRLQVAGDIALGPNSTDFTIANDVTYSGRVGIARISGVTGITTFTETPQGGPQYNWLFNSSFNTPRDYNNPENSIIFLGMGYGNPNANERNGTMLRISPTHNKTNNFRSLLRGIMYKPILTAIPNVIHRAIETWTGDVVLGVQSGRVVIGDSIVDPASIFDVKAVKRGSRPYPSLTTSQRDSIYRGVLSVTVTNGGTGYVATTTFINVTGCNGREVQLVPTILAGVITAISVRAQGFGFECVPTITITSTGSGTGATATAILTPVPTGLTIYNTTTSQVEYWNGSAWVPFLSGSSTELFRGFFVSDGTTVGDTITRLDTLVVTGNGNVTTSITGDTLTISSPEKWLKTELEAGQDVNISSASSTDFRIQNTRVQFDNKFKIGSDSSLVYDPVQDTLFIMGDGTIKGITVTPFKFLGPNNTSSNFKAQISIGDWESSRGWNIGVDASENGSNNFYFYNNATGALPFALVGKTVLVGNFDLTVPSGLSTDMHVRSTLTDGFVVSNSGLTRRWINTGNRLRGLKVGGITSFSKDVNVDTFYNYGVVRFDALGTGTATTILGKTSTNEIVPVSLSSLGNGIYGGSATLSQHTTRARVPDNGNLYFSQTYNGGADSTYWQIVNYGGGERAFNFGLTDTSSTGYSRAQFYSDGTGAMNWGLETSDALFGNTLVRAFEGDLLLSTSEGQISLAAPVDSELSMTGMVKAKQEAYYEINSTSSPQNLSNTYSDNFINQGGTQATFTLVFPASPEDGQVLTITYNNNISTLTLDGNGNTIVGTTVTTAVAGSQRKFKFYAGEGVWIRIY